ncbi:MAG: hypothetical protein K9J06_10965 [Flavobacteriales bacterium]|nr:hypothetical protein [Flavobacteriales bacterium]
MHNFFALIIACLAASTCVAQQKIGPAETFHVKESNVMWSAAVTDTLELCVINAENIAIMNTSFPKEKNITKQVSFKLRNANGEGRTVNGRVEGIANFGGEQLYTAMLEIGLNLGDRWEYRTVPCILADLSASEHRLIIGRNWLGEDFTVE